MKTFGGVPATTRLTSGLDPACSCGTAISVILLPRASNSLTMTFSAPISLSFDHEWKSLSSVAPAAATDKAPITAARPTGTRYLRNIVSLPVLLLTCSA
jgi:hypothetical protein